VSWPLLRKEVEGGASREVFKKGVLRKTFVLNERYVGVLINLWLFLFSTQPKELFLDGLKKLEQ
jgi:hypothetical protein